MKTHLSVGDQVQWRAHKGANASVGIVAKSEIIYPEDEESRPYELVTVNWVNRRGKIRSTSQHTFEEIYRIKLPKVGDKVRQRSGTRFWGYVQSVTEVSPGECPDVTVLWKGGSQEWRDVEGTASAADLMVQAEPIENMWDRREEEERLEKQKRAKESRV